MGRGLTPQRSRCANAMLRCGLLLACILSANASWSAESAESADIGREQARLDTLTGEIRDSESRRDKLQAAADRLKGEARILQKQLIVAAARIQSKEADVAQLEKDLRGLREVETKKVSMLERRSAELANTLAALQRLGRQPPSAFLTRPQTAIDAVRSASLLGNVVPSLRAEAIDLGEEIAALKQLRDEIFEDRQRLNSAATQLDAERKKLDRLVRRKRAEQNRFSEHAKEQADRALRLAAKAKSIRDLIGRLDAAQHARNKPAKSGKKKRFLGLNQALLGGRPFSSARGGLPLPAHGQISLKFGQLDDTGRPLRGIYIETMGLARVTAPYDGQIVYAGPFRDYGQLLIIAHGEGYHTLLAGMSQIDGIVGQWVLSGEPIGQMGPGNTADRSLEKPKLYVELRRHGEPINPLPWLAANKRKVSG